MIKIGKYLCLCFLILACNNLAKRENAEPSSDSESKIEKQTTVQPQKVDLNMECLEQLGRLQNPLTNEESIKYCSGAKKLAPCDSVMEKPIFHFSKESAKDRHIKVLVFGAIHGDEPASASLARDWVIRLKDLDPRSQWRIVPILNPDGLFNQTRVNANGVDINRNFATKDWIENAQSYWRVKSGANPRRFPGNLGGSEPETQCAAAHIEDFKPDFIISVHTPYGVLDFDGPHVDYPANRLLPWRRLGHMPGSLGRFMWKDKEVPVLTIELKGSEPLSPEMGGDMQDTIGTLAIRALKKLNRY